MDDDDHKDDVGIALLAGLDSIVKDNKDLKKSLRESTNECNALKDQNLELQEDIATKDKNLAASHAKIGANEERIQALNGTLTTMSSEITSRDKNISKLESEIVKIASEKDTEIKNLKVLLVDTTQALQDKTAHAEQLTDALGQLQAQYSSLHAAFEETTQTLQQAERDRDSFRKQYEDTNVALGESRLEVEKLNKHVWNISDQLKDTNNQLEESDRLKARYHSDSLEFEEQAKAFEAEKINLSKELRDLEEIHKNDTKLAKQREEEQNALIKEKEENIENLSNELMTVRDFLNQRQYDLEQLREQHGNLEDNYAELEKTFKEEQQRFEGELMSVQANARNKQHELESLLAIARETSNTNQHAMEEEQKKLKAALEAHARDSEVRLAELTKMREAAAESRAGIDVKHEEVLELRRQMSNLEDQHKTDRQEWDAREADFREEIQQMTEGMMSLSTEVSRVRADCKRENAEMEQDLVETKAELEENKESLQSKSEALATAETNLKATRTELDETRKNLETTKVVCEERVQELATSSDLESKRHLAQEERTQKQQELQKSEIERLVVELRRLEREIKNLKTERDRLQDGSDIVKDELSKSSSQVRELKEELQECQQSLEDSHAERLTIVQGLRTELDIVRSELLDVKRSESSLKMSLETSMSEASEARGRIDEQAEEFQSRIDMLNAELSRLTARVNSVRSEADKERSESLNLRNTVSRLEADLHDAESQKVTITEHLNGTIQKLKKDLSSCERRENNLKQKEEQRKLLESDSTNSIIKLQADLDARNTEIDSLQTDLKRAKKAEGRAITELKGLKSRHGTVEEELKSLKLGAKQDISTLDDRLETCMQQLEESRQASLDKDRICSELRAKLHSIQSHANQTIRSLMAELQIAQQHDSEEKGRLIQEQQRAKDTLSEVEQERLLAMQEFESKIRRLEQQIESLQAKLQQVEDERRELENQLEQKEQEIIRIQCQDIDGRQGRSNCLNKLKSTVADIRPSTQSSLQRPSTARSIKSIDSTNNHHGVQPNVLSAEHPLNSGRSQHHLNANRSALDLIDHQNSTSPTSFREHSDKSINDRKANSPIVPVSGRSISRRSSRGDLLAPMDQTHSPHDPHDATRHDSISPHERQPSRNRRPASPTVEEKYNQIQDYIENKKRAEEIQRRTQKSQKKSNAVNSGLPPISKK